MEGTTEKKKYENFQNFENLRNGYQHDQQSSRNRKSPLRATLKPHERSKENIAPGLKKSQNFKNLQNFEKLEKSNESLQLKYLSGRRFSTTSDTQSHKKMENIANTQPHPLNKKSKNFSTKENPKQNPIKYTSSNGSNSSYTSNRYKGVVQVPGLSPSPSPPSQKQAVDRYEGYRRNFNVSQ
jgi:hypothetical protein